MATGSQCGQARIWAGSHFPRAAAGQGAAPSPPGARGTARTLPLPLRASRHGQRPLRGRGRRIQAAGRQW